MGLEGPSDSGWNDKGEAANADFFLWLVTGGPPAPTSLACRADAMRRFNIRHCLLLRHAA